MCVLIYDSCVYDYKAFSSLERDWMMEFLEDLVLASIRSGGFIFSMTAFVHMEFSSVCWSPSKSLHTLCAYFLSQLIAFLNFVMLLSYATLTSFIYQLFIPDALVVGCTFLDFTTHQCIPYDYRVDEAGKNNIFICYLFLFCHKAIVSIVIFSLVLCRLV